MSLFSFFKFTRSQPPPSNARVAGVVDHRLLSSQLYGKFNQAFISSFTLKDQASLTSALRMRQQATESVRNIPALYCLGKHHEMILEYNHMGHGVEARLSALESLKHHEEFKSISKELCSKLSYDFYSESMDYTATTSGSYEESLQYLSQLKEQFPTEINKRKCDELKKIQAECGRWYMAQRSILANYYSRVSNELDNGKYAAALSIIDIILSNAEKTGYSLDYEEYTDLLDDMCILSIKLLVQKEPCRPKVRSLKEDAVELGCIVKKPLAYLTEFIPGCLPKDRSLFEHYYEEFATLPWINEVPEWEKLTLLMAPMWSKDSDIPTHVTVEKSVSIEVTTSDRTANLPSIREDVVDANFVFISGGEFTMGSPVGEVGRDIYKLSNIASNETQHQVMVSDFYISKYAVTVKEFKRFIEESGYRTDAENGGYSFILEGKAKVNWRYGVSGIVRPQTEENHPVVHVSWNDAVAYCVWISEKTGMLFRLPTEAEWEYACRAGTTTPFNTGDNLTTEQANYNGGYSYKNYQNGCYRANTVSVDSLTANSLGLYNMHGNVFEWCGDAHGGGYYDDCNASGIVINPLGPATGLCCVLRGGAWDSYAEGCRSAFRLNLPRDIRTGDVGFRLVLKK